MVTDLAILLAAFAGSKLIGVVSRRRARRRNRITRIPRNEDPDSRLHTIIDAPEKVYDRYAKISLVSMGLVSLTRFMPWLYPLSLAVMIYTCIPILHLGSKQVIRRRMIGHDALYAFFILLAFASRQQPLMTISVFFYHAGLKLFARNQAKTEPIIAHIFKQQPGQVWVVKDGVELEMPTTELQVGDIVSLRTGEVVAIDGLVVEGMASIDQHALTGESQPVDKGIGDQVFASTILVTGRIRVRVDKAGSETAIRKIGEILAETAAYSSLIQLQGERWSNRIAAPMFGLTVMALPTLGLLGAATVAHSGFSNRIRVVAPLGTLSYLHLAFNKGLLIKDGRAMEELKKIDTLVFDKTGTLTQDQPEVGEILVFDDAFAQDEILAYAAAAESRVAHPLAAAIVAKAEQSGIEPGEVDDAHYNIGYGITVDLAGRSIRVGSMRFLEAEGVSPSQASTAALEGAQAQGHSLVMVAVDQRVAGAIEIQSAMRPEVKQVIRGLRERGIKRISIVSGDHEPTTQIVAESLGVDDYAYEVLPPQKAALVEGLQRDGKKVCFVGDGINDALAMKVANVSVSMRGATTVATDTAQVVLLDGSLSRLCEVFDLSRGLHRNLIRGLAMIAIPSMFNISGAFLLGFRMVTSTLIVNTSFLLALANAMQPRVKRTSK